MGHRLIVALTVRKRRFACSNEVESYIDVTTGRASLAGQASIEERDEVCPTTAHLVYPSTAILSYHFMSSVPSNH